MGNADVLVLDMMNEQILKRFNGQYGTDLIADISAEGAVIAIGMGLLGEEVYREQGAILNDTAQSYWQNAGSSNQLGLLKFAAQKAGIKGLVLPEPEASIDFGFYYPSGDGGRVFGRWEEFDAFRDAQGLKTNGPRVAISFYKASYYTGDMALIDAVIAEVEKQGGQAIPTFGYPGAIGYENLLLNSDGSARVDIALAANLQFSDDKASGRLDKINVPIVNLISLYGRSEDDWRSSDQGLSFLEGTFNLAVPELAGTIAPTVVGTKERRTSPESGLTAVVATPIQRQVERAVSRAFRYADLQSTPNAEKRIALMYYNYPPGKSNIGASYLNVAESLARILARMAEEGYDIGASVPDADQILSDITEKARNVIGRAPGELEDLVATSDATAIPMTQYNEWLNTYSETLRDKIVSDWGAPSDAALMAVDTDQGKALVIPAVTYGNVVLMPQPSRAWGEDLHQLYHAKDLAPHHQYVAAYSWLREGFDAHAVVHIGTHGTLEWLDGKAVGLNEDDAPDALIADLPNPYIYNVDVVGEGLVARRRAAATIVDHMTPPFVRGELTEDLAKLRELVNDHMHNDTKNPELAEAYNRQIRDQIIAMGIAKDLGFSPDDPFTHDNFHEVEDYLYELQDQIVPYGMHAFGRTPEKEAIDSTVGAIVLADRSALPDARDVMTREMEQRIKASGPQELDRLIEVLSGRFIPTGVGGEPIRNPDAYPTGKNFVGIDPNKVPKPAAYEIGVELAEQMLEDHLAENGRYPEKVSFVIWGDETIRHEGILESQVFHLLGTKPVWNDRGKVVDVELIPQSELKRPRIDIVIASASEGLFSNVTNLMDKAVQLAKAQDELDNYVRRHYLETRSALIKMGRSEEDAERLAGIRIFDEPPGTYNLNTSKIVANSGSWDTTDGFANDYIRKMGHGYGNGSWGEPMEDVFRLNLAGVEKVVHSSSTNLYGGLDSDDMFMYVGGLAKAVETLGGDAPSIVITESSDPGNPQMVAIDKFIGKEFRSRYVNPVWIEGMQNEGYAGAGAMRDFVEYLWGWDATATNVVDEGMWQETYETYVEDKHNMEMAAFFDAHSPHAFQDIVARMIETTRKEYWVPTDDVRKRLLVEYVDSVNRHGAACSEVTCGNARLLSYIFDEALAAGVPAPSVARARASLEELMDGAIDNLAGDLIAFAQRNDANEAEEAAAARETVSQGRLFASSANAPLKGLLMEEEDRTPTTTNEASSSNSTELRTVDVIWPPLAALALLFGWAYWPFPRPHAS
ncbi:MAG: cobaltochelatase subunit CobN [Pseudomonadota bacterium]